MSYEKQTWVPYDDNLSEEENINAGAIVTAERMNYLEGGLQQHTEDVDNPHQITKTQVGLGNVDNVQQASKEDFDNHLGNKLNPHSVTASQVGAYSKAEADGKYLAKTDASEQLEGYYTKTQSDSKFLSKTEAASTYLVKGDVDNIYIPRDKLYLTYPIGAPYLSFLPDNPATVLGGGTWEREAIGRTLVGVDENDPDFATAGLTGGEKTHVLTIGEMPSHAHSPASGNEQIVNFRTAATSNGAPQGSSTQNRYLAGSDATAATGGGLAHNNLPPYTTIYIWRRTA